MATWRKLGFRLALRRLCSSPRRLKEDECCWSYSSEWCSPQPDGLTVFRHLSDKGNGAVSVVSFPSSKPEPIYWRETEKWLNKRYSLAHSGAINEPIENFKIDGYQWRVLRFNDNTRQSTVKVMAAHPISDPASTFFMQQAHCLAVPYLRSLVSAGFTTCSCNFDLMSVAYGKKIMHILCVGHGGGSLPLFLAAKIQGAIVDVVEIDPIVIRASVEAMGFPPASIMKNFSKPNVIHQMLWEDIHKRLVVYESDAESFISRSSTTYDIVLVDAYDGDDVFPRTLWDPHYPFLRFLDERLHPEHGTVVVNLHADADMMCVDGDNCILPMGKYVGAVCRAYKEALVGDGWGYGKKALAFAVGCPYLCNTSLVVTRGWEGRGGFVGRDHVINMLMSKCSEVESALNLPFSCLDYLKRGFVLVD